MIQTKTLKEALKDPGVIEVVGELLGTASSTTNGLMSSSTYKKTAISQKKGFSTESSEEELKNISETGLYDILGCEIFGSAKYGQLFHLQSKYTFQLLFVGSAKESIPSLYIRYKTVNSGWTNFGKII